MAGLAEWCEFVAYYIFSECKGVSKRAANNVSVRT